MAKVFWATILFQLALWALVVGLQRELWEPSPEWKITTEQPCDGPSFGYDITLGPAPGEADMWDI